jgi:hypothetical protein
LLYNKPGWGFYAYANSFSGFLVFDDGDDFAFVVYSPHHGPFGFVGQDFFCRRLAITTSFPFHPKTSDGQEEKEDGRRGNASVFFVRQGGKKCQSGNE